jgi:DNA-directed RNA polymerase subunit RPC12/RpoP
LVTVSNGNYKARCPRCKANALWRVPGRFYEGGFRVLKLYPYACDDCGARSLMIGRHKPLDWRRIKVRIVIPYESIPAPIRRLFSITNENPKEQKARAG